ncbi:cytochrome c maturation protein CcmE [Amaricoccus tamworthensis]|uniref:cytochrome c maturation protein CcmE n=1 Tax=Amaricoccus tamworthensis TaxID=57002 RepID=UPI003C7BA1E2
MAVGLKKRRRIQLVIIGTVMLAISAGLIGFGLRDGIEFFRSPSQIAEQRPDPGERFRVGGLVVEGSLQRGSGETVAFTVTDGAAETRITYQGILPDLFREGQGVIALGSMDNDTFVASEVLAKHDESYMPREVADALKEQGLFRHGEGIDGGGS